MEIVSSKEPRISVRVAPELKSRIEEMITTTGLKEAVLVQNCIEALCDHVEKTGQISFPMAIIPKAASVQYPKHRVANPALNEAVSSDRPSRVKDNSDIVEETAIDKRGRVTRSKPRK